MREVNGVDGERRLRVAIADPMSAQACVNCHNSRADTPKNDWQLGDVRGVLEVNSSLENQLIAGQSMVREILLGLLGGGALLALMIGLLARHSTRPLLDISGALRRLIEGERDVLVDHWDRKDEVGGIASSVRYFQEKLVEIDELQREIAAVVSACALGDFSQRVSTEGKDAALADLCAGVNRIGEVANHGLQEVMCALRALSEGNLAHRMNGTYSGVFQDIHQAMNATAQSLADMVVRIEESVPIRLSPTPTICRVWRRVAREADEAGMDVPQREDLSFLRSLPEFQRLFPDDAACAAYLEKARWGDGFVCPHCQTAAEPFRFTSRPGVLRCRKCRRDTGLTAGTVMERSHTSLGVWFWAAYLVASQTPGMSATQFQRQVGLSRYETAFQILHKLRAGMVRPDQDRIGSEACDHVEVDETWVGGRTRGKGRGVHHKLLVASAVEVRQRKPGTKLDKRKGGRYAGRVRLAVVPDRSAESLCGFVEGAVTSGASVITDDWSGYTSLAKRGYKHLAVAERGNSQVAEEYLPIIHLVFANLKTWLSGIHHGVSHQHLQAYLNEFTFRFNRRFCPFNAFRSLLGIAGDVTAPTYAELYSGDWEHPRCSGCR